MLAVYWFVISIINSSVALSCCLIKSPPSAGPEVSFLLAKEKKLFEKYDLKNDFEFAKPQMIVDQLRRGGATVGILPSTLAAHLVSRDKNLVIFATIFKGWDNCLWASPAIKDFKQKTPILVAVSPWPSMDKLAAFAAFGESGVPLKDIKFKQVYGIKGQIKVAKKSKGTVVLPIPWTVMAKEKGLKKVYDLSALKANIPHTVMVTNRDYLSNHTNTLKKLILTYQESVTLAKKNKDIMKSLIKKSYGIDDKRIVDSIYNFYILERMSIDVRPTKKMWLNFADLVKNAGWSKVPDIKTLYYDDVRKKLYD